MTHCAQAGTLSPRTTEPPVVHKELAEVLANPVIAVVRSAEELAEALTSRVSAIEIRSGDIASLPALIDRVRAARKSVRYIPNLLPALAGILQRLIFSADTLVPPRLFQRKSRFCRRLAPAV